MEGKKSELINVKILEELVFVQSFQYLKSNLNISTNELKKQLLSMLEEDLIEMTHPSPEGLFMFEIELFNKNWSSKGN